MSDVVNVYPVGQRVEVAILVEDENDAAANPDGITGYVRDPDGEETAYPAGDLVHAGVGDFRMRFTLTKPGRWHYGSRTTNPDTGKWAHLIAETPPFDTFA